MTETGRKGATAQQGILEVQGWFPDNTSPQATIQELRSAGYARVDASLREDAGLGPGRGMQADLRPRIASRCAP